MKGIISHGSAKSKMVLGLLQFWYSLNSYDLISNTDISGSMWYIEHDSHPDVILLVPGVSEWTMERVPLRPDFGLLLELADRAGRLTEPDVTDGWPSPSISPSGPKRCFDLLDLHNKQVTVVMCENTIIMMKVWLYNCWRGVENVFNYMIIWPLERERKGERGRKGSRDREREVDRDREKKQYQMRFLIIN